MGIVRKKSEKTTVNPIAGSVTTTKKMMPLGQKSGMVAKTKETIYPKNLSPNKFVTEKSKKNIFGQNVTKKITKNETGKVMSVKKVKSYK
jgi:hypothetical protein